jgi:hypothetical protein
MKHKSFLFALLMFIPLGITACQGSNNLQPTPTGFPHFTSTSITLTQTPTVPTQTVTPLAINTAMPTPASTITATPEPGTPPGCMIINNDGKLYVLSNKEFSYLGTGAKKLNQVLADNYPEWANYKQNVPWNTEPVKLGEIVLSASLNEELNLQINPAVTLVTLGITLGWQLPANSDLFLKSREISQNLNHLAFDWTKDGSEQVRARYPEVSNEASYALYVFFNYDKEKLQIWCNTYQRLFGTSP